VGVPAVSSRAVRTESTPERGTPSPPDRRRAVRTDGSTPIPGSSRAGSDPRSTRSARRGGSEVAQRVWQCSLELAGTGRHIHLPDHALALSRTAGYDPDTMTHAFAL
jgi:hypothetical protein